MANEFFDPFISEEDSNLLRQLNEDMIYDRGVGVDYLPRKSILNDDVMNEPIVTMFNLARPIDIYIENSDGYVIPDAMMDFSGIGFGTNSTKCHVSRRLFEEQFDDLPSEGDLFYINSLKRIFEVINVDSVDPLLSGGRFFTFTMTIQPYAYSEGSQHFDLDNVDTQNVSDDFKEILGHVDIELCLNNLADFSSTLITFDNVAQFIEDKSFRITFDSTHSGLQSGVTFDQNTVTFDQTNGSTFDQTHVNYKENEQLFKELSDVKDPLTSNNADIDCEDPKIQRTVSTNPFGFF